MNLLTSDTLEPAPITNRVNARGGIVPARSVRALLRANASEQLETIGLTIGERTAPPEGERIVAFHWERDQRGVPVMVITETEPIPEPEPDPVLTRIEALEDAARLDLVAVRQQVQSSSNANQLRNAVTALLDEMDNRLEG